MTTTYVRHPGRRGGLSLRSPTTVAPAAGAATLPSMARAFKQRIRWTLVFTSFLAFVGVVISARLRIGQELVIAGIVGLIIQGERLRWGTVTPLLALWMAWCAIGIIASDYPDVVTEGVTQLAKLCVIALVGVNAMRTRAHVRAFSAFVVFAFLIYPGRGALLNWVTGAYTAKGRAVWNGVYANPNDLAAVALLILAIAVSFAVGERSARLKLAALGSAGFIAFIIFLTQSRGVIIGLGVFVVALLWRVPRRQRARSLAVVALAGAVIVAFAPADVWDRMAGLRNATDTENLREVDSSAEQRWMIWQVARTIIAEHPVMGVGVGAYKLAHGQTAMRPEFPAFGGGNRDTHSTYLNVAAETGLPGLALFTLIVGATVWSAERARRRVARRDPTGGYQILILQVGLVAYLVAGIWGSYAALNVLYIYLVLLWAAAHAFDAENAAPGTLPINR